MEPKYDQIYQYGNKGVQWALVRENGLYGFIDKMGKEIVPPKYDKINHFNSNNRQWAMVEVNGKVGFLDKTGKEIVPAVLTDLYSDGLMELASLFSSKGDHLEGLGAVKNYWVSPFNAGYAVIKSKKTSKFGVINKSLTLVLPPEHEKIMVDDKGNVHVW